MPEPSLLTPEEKVNLLRNLQLTDAGTSMKSEQPEQPAQPEPQQAQPVVPGPTPAPYPDQMPVQAQAPQGVQADPQLPILQEQLARAQAQGGEPNVGEKLLSGFMSLPGLRQTLKPVVDQFVPDRGAANKQALDISGRIANLKRLYEKGEGEQEAGRALMFLQHPDVFKQMQGLSKEAQGAFVKHYVEMNKMLADSAQSAASAKKSNIDADLAVPYYNLAVQKLEEAKRAAIAKEKQERERKAREQAFKDETAVRETTQRAIVNARSTPYIGKLYTAMTGADDVHALLMNSTQGGEGNIILNRPSVGEVMASLQRTLSMGGQSSVEMMKEITPESLRGDAAKMVEWATGHPTEYLTDAQFKNLIEVSKRQQSILREAVKRAQEGALISIKPILDRDRERNGGVSPLEKVFRDAQEATMVEIGRGGDGSETAKKIAEDQKLRELEEMMRALEAKAAEGAPQEGTQ